MVILRIRGKKKGVGILLSLKVSEKALLLNLERKTTGTLVEMTTGTSRITGLTRPVKRFVSVYTFGLLTFFRYWFPMQHSFVDPTDYCVYSSLINTGEVSGHQ